MGAPLQSIDLLADRWRSLSDLARKDDGPFPAALPQVCAVAFDQVKDAISSYRGWELCSVDAVTTADDGRILFLEFKDTERSEISWLRKKGFDSLFLFWIAIGSSLSMEEIRDRAVFCYVYTGKKRYDHDIRKYLDLFANNPPQRYQADQIEKTLQGTGLYGDVKTLTPEDFGNFIQELNVAQSIDEVRRAMSVRYQLPNPRSRAPRINQRAVDLRTIVLPIAELRMCDPFDAAKHKKETNVLRLADGYDESTESISCRHDWRPDFPVMRLMACCFDTFMMWCLAFHSNDRMDQIGGRLKGTIAFDNASPVPAELPEPSPTNGWRHSFWSVYAPYYPERYGLKALEVAGFYNSLICTSSS